MAGRTWPLGSAPAPASGQICTREIDVMGQRCPWREGWGGEGSEPGWGEVRVEMGEGSGQKWGVRSPGRVGSEVGGGKRGGEGKGGAGRGGEAGTSAFWAAGLWGLESQPLLRGSTSGQHDVGTVSSTGPGLCPRSSWMPTVSPS